MNLETFFFIHFCKFYRFMSVQTSFFSIKSFNFIFHFIYQNILEAEKGNNNNWTITLKILILGWYWYFNDAFLTRYLTFPVLCIWQSFCIIWSFWQFHRKLEVCCSMGTNIKGLNITAQNVSLFGIFVVHIFLHLD